MEMQKRIPELDGVRGLAILMVLIFHYFTILLPQEIPLHSLVWYGKSATSLFLSGVDLFFVLSGFFIGGIIIDNHAAPNLYKVFYLRRACRILPPYTMLLTAAFVLRHTMGHQYSWIAQHQLSSAAYLTFTQNFAMAFHGGWAKDVLDVTWSLAVEEQFYLFLPALLYIVGFQRWVLVLVPIMLAAPVLRLAFNGFGSSVLMPFRMDGLLFGVLIAYAFRQRLFFDLFRKHPWLPWSIFLVLLAGFMRASLRNVLGYLNYAYLACFYGSFVILAVTRSGSKDMALLRAGPLRYLGKISYGFYLYHVIILVFLHALILKRLPWIGDVRGQCVTALALIATLVASTASFYLIERPFQDVGHRHAFTPANASADEAGVHGPDTRFARILRLVAFIGKRMSGRSQ